MGKYIHIYIHKTFIYIVLIYRERYLRFIQFPLGNTLNKEGNYLYSSVIKKWLGRSLGSLAYIIWPSITNHWGGAGYCV